MTENLTDLYEAYADEYDEAQRHDAQSAGLPSHGAPVTGATKTRHVVVTYSAFMIDTHGDGGSETVHNSKMFAVEADASLSQEDSDQQILNRLFRETNTYTGDLYDTLRNDFDRRGIPARTTLSVGDIVTIGVNSYLCAPMGWTPLGFLF